jgi:hypothetical protein
MEGSRVAGKAETWVPLTMRGAAPLETNRSVQTGSKSRKPDRAPLMKSKT